MRYSFSLINLTIAALLVIAVPVVPSPGGWLPAIAQSSQGRKAQADELMQRGMG